MGLLLGLENIANTESECIQNIKDSLRREALSTSKYRDYVEESDEETNIYHAAQYHLADYILRRVDVLRLITSSSSLEFREIFNTIEKYQKEGHRYLKISPFPMGNHPAYKAGTHAYCLKFLEMLHKSKI